MDVLDAISYMLLFLAAGPFLDKLFLKQGDTVNRHHQGNRSDDSEGLKPKGCHLILAKRNLFRRDPISGVTSKRQTKAGFKRRV